MTQKIKIHTAVKAGRQRVGLTAANHVAEQFVATKPTWIERSGDHRVTTGRPWLGAGILAAIVFACVSTATAGRPGDPTSNIDYLGSGFATPEGLAAAAQVPGGVATAGSLPPALANGGIQQVGFLSGGPGLLGGPGWLNQNGASCDGMSCGGCASCNMGGCDMGAYGSCGCNDGCGCSGGGGLLGKLSGNSCGDCGSGSCNGGILGRLRGLGGGNVSTCQALQYHIGSVNPVAAIGMLRPYTDAGICAQRWYDLSIEALFLGRTTGGLGSGGVITRSEVGFNAPAVLTDDNIGAGDLEAGTRISGALIFGAGGNLELTYMGGQEWNGSATAQDPVNPRLFSYISDFGLQGTEGFDDTDRSFTQTASSTAEFHSGELNYRRRTMGPYCRFQGSWLFGMRYMRFDNAVGFNTDGGVVGFFNGRDDVKNSLFGAQVGGDLWWNAMPGINIGIEGKGAWLKNEVDSVTEITSNSLPNAISTSRTLDEGTLAIEFQTKLIYRLSHSWSFRSAYYVIAIDEVGAGALDADLVTSIVDPASTGALEPEITLDSLVLQGFSVGAEYVW